LAAIEPGHFLMEDVSLGRCFFAKNIARLWGNILEMVNLSVPYNSHLLRTERIALCAHVKKNLSVGPWKAFERVPPKSGALSAACLLSFCAGVTTQRPGARLRLSHHVTHICFYDSPTPCVPIFTLAPLFPREHSRLQTP
jgi:hypothetical protein